MSKKIFATIFVLSFVMLLVHSGSQASSNQPNDTYRSYLPLAVRVDPPAWIGPEGGKVVAVAAAPSDPQVVFAGTWGSGVFKSLDGGANWLHAKAGLDNLLINSLAVDPTNALVVYAGTYKSGIYKSVDQGESWQPINNGLLYDNTIVYTIAVNPQNPQNLYMGTRSSDGTGLPPWRGIVYRSMDGGNSWVSSLQNAGGVASQDWVYALSIFPASPNIVLAASHEHGLYRTADYGASWQRVSEGIEDGSGRGVVFDPLSSIPGTAYYGTWHFGGIYKSTSGGDVWTNVGANNLKIYTMSIDPTAPNHVYAALPNNGVLKTADGGATWYLTGLGAEEVAMLAVNPANSDILYAATFNGGMFTSFNQGGSWAQTNHGLLMASATSLLGKPGDPNQLYMSTMGNGVARSTDGGKTWLPLNENLGDLFIHALVMDPAHANILFALTDAAGLYRIDLDGVGGWQPVAKNLPVIKDGLPLAWPAGAPKPEPVDEVFSQADSLPAEATLLTMSFAPSNAAIAYLGLAGGGVYKSTDGGGSWNPTTLSGQTIWNLVVNPANSDLVYAASDVAGSLKMSGDGGANWGDLALPGVTFYGLSISPLDPGTLYAATSHGIYTDTGSGWTFKGLPGQAAIAVMVHPTRPGLVFAGTAQGAWLSTDGGQTWQPGPAELGGYRVQGIHADPNNPTLIYFDTDSGGCLRFSLP